MNNQYIGHSSQLYGVEEHRLVGGMGDGMRLFEVRNGKGLEFTVAADRAADISRLLLNGINLGYFAPCGYVAPAYYDRFDTGFFKSFYAGFLTTCGLQAVGVPCEDNGESLPLHGTVSNIPAEHIYWREENDEIVIYATVKDERLFSHKLVLQREIHCSLCENVITIKDKVTNLGDTDYPVMFLYHMNMGYPLLCENSVLTINSKKVVARNERAQEGINEWDKLQKPEVGFEEQCYFHSFEGNGIAQIYNPDLKVGIKISFDSEKLPYFTEWKMMGVRDYALGLEPGNSHPDGRDVMRKQGKLQILKPGETADFGVQITAFGIAEKK